VTTDERTGEVVIHGAAADVLGPAVTIDAERPTEVLAVERTRPASAPGPARLVDGAELAVTGQGTDDLTAIALGLLALGTVLVRAANRRPHPRSSRGSTGTGRPRWGGPWRARAQGTR
jgi:hypothetical protein